MNAEQRARAWEKVAGSIERDVNLWLRSYTAAIKKAALLNGNLQSPPAEGEKERQEANGKS